MVIGARTGAWRSSGGGVPTAADYVNDGLVDIIDFYENAGYGVFDPNLVNWRSLKSSSITASPWGRGNLPYFRDNGYYYCLNSVALNFTSYSRVSFAGEFTIEFCGFATNSFCGIPTYSRDTVIYLGLFGSSKGWITSLPATFGSMGKDPYTCPHAIRMTCNNFNVMVGNDGYGLYDNVIDFSGKSLGYSNVSAKPNSTSIEGACNFKCLRIYNRVLTASELAANYAVDKARFNLP